MESRHVSCVINLPPQAVYDFASDPDNLSKWAEGLAKAEVTRDGDDLLLDSPMGEVRVRFMPRNAYGG